MTGTDGHGCSWRFYESPKGGKVVRKEIADLNDAFGRQSLADAMTLYAKGEAFERHVSSLGDGLLEIRVNVGNNHYRTIFYHPKPFIAVALKVFYKNSNKTPKPMIDVAKRRRQQREEG